MSENARAHIFIEGRVQGVGFRHFTKKNARNLNVKGWVKNLNDGRVEAVMEGNKDQVEQLIEHCRKGPPISKVSNLDVEWEEFKDEFDSFRVAF